MFLTTKDVVKYLKRTPRNILDSIMTEIVSYPQGDVSDIGSIGLATLEYDGTLESFQDAINKISSDNKVMESISIEWVGLIMRYFYDQKGFDSYCINSFKGVLISQNELPFFYIKNTSCKEISNRYMRISYESIRSILTDIDRREFMNNSLKRNYIPSIGNANSFILGVAAGVFGLLLIAYKIDNSVDIE